MAEFTRAAIVYDFDGTLSPNAMQEHTLIPELGFSDPMKFWKSVKEDNLAADGDEILSYMFSLLQHSTVRPSREHFAKHGRELTLFEGLPEWFNNMNQFATSQEIALEHYVISSGLEEMISASPLASHFRHIFASKYRYDEEGHAVWPAASINYTTKTQYLFRINKGVLNYWDDRAVNRWIPMDERPIPFEHMIFIGDGDTDIPAMKMLRYQGGCAIAVFDPTQFKSSGQTKMYNLIAEDRANYVCPADYSTNSQLDVVVRGVLGRIARSNGFRE